MLMSKADALSAITRLEVLCRDFGFPDEHSKSEMLQIVQNIRSHGPEDGYFREKLFNIGMWAQDGFSTRKFQKYPGGASQLTILALGDCSTVRNLIEEHWPRG